MASTTKYQPAPQRDSLDEPGYSQAPPTYQDAGPSDNSGYGTTTRSEDDNVPDDFKFGTSVSECDITIRMAFIRKVYTILTCQIFLTAGLSAISFFSDGYRHWIQDNSWAMWTSLFGAIGFMLVTFWKRKSYPTNVIFLTGFTVLEAYSISVITSFYESRIVLQALVITLAIFVALTLFAVQSKYDFTAWQPYLFGALWILIIFGFMATFVGGPKTELIYSGAAALIFSGYILVDTQLVMRHYQPEEEIAAAISLYLDVLNLFLAILRILNSQNNN